MARTIFGVIAGYFLFVVTSLALFKLSGQNPHDTASAGFIILTLIYGAFFSIVSGFAAQRIAGTKTLTVNYILAGFIIGFATFSLVKAQGSSWTQLLAISIFGPVSVLGGYIGIPKAG